MIYTEHDELRDAIAAYVAANPGLSAKAISDGVGALHGVVPDSMVRSRLEVLVKRDQLRREGTSLATRYFPARSAAPTWKIPEEFEQAPSIWRVAQRVAAEVRGVDWRAQQ